MAKIGIFRPSVLLGALQDMAVCALCLHLEHWICGELGVKVMCVGLKISADYGGLGMKRMRTSITTW